MAKHLLSFDLHADFACFKKPDVNEGLILTFNCLHKPALLGILGAIAGLQGYARKGEFPKYYQLFKNLRVSIQPVDRFHEKGNFSKAILSYTNTVGYANEDGNLIVTEQTLVRPAYRCYVELDDTMDQQAVLYRRLKNGESVYIPYLGKNEFAAWWEKDSVKEYSYSSFQPDRSFKISSLFIRQYPVLFQRIAPKFSPTLQAMTNTSSFIYFERLPLSFDETMFQYELAEFAFTDWVLKEDSVVQDLYQIKSGGEAEVIQLF